MWSYFPTQSLSYSEGPGYVIVSFGMKSKPFWGDKTVWLYFPAKHLSHSEGSWLCDYTSSQKSIPFWGDLTMCLYPKEWNQYHSEGTWLCDYISSPKSIPRWGDLTVWLYPKEWSLTHSEGNWLCDYTFQPKTYPTPRGPDYVIILSSQKSFTFRGKLINWLCPKQWNLWHIEGTWLCDYTFQLKIYPIWGDLTMWSYFPA